MYQCNLGDTDCREILYYENFDTENLFTLVNVDKYEELLKLSQYDTEKTEELVRGFREGFTLGYRGPTNIAQMAPNLKFNIGDEIDLSNKVMKEVKAKRYVGPFPEIPFKKNYIQSPIGLVLKDNGKDTRLIFHLSYPRNGKGYSVNGCTPPELCKVKYPDFTEAVKMCVGLGRSCHISRSDMKAAFRNLCMKRSDWRYLVMKVRSPLDGK